LYDHRVQFELLLCTLDDFLFDCVFRYKAKNLNLSLLANPMRAIWWNDNIKTKLDKLVYAGAVSLIRDSSLTLSLQVSLTVDESNKRKYVRSKCQKH